MCQEEKISIVIPAFNCEKTIGRCLDSALAQTWSNTEIIAVDDGSTDQTGSILDTYQKEYSYYLGILIFYDLDHQYIQYLYQSHALLLMALE